MVMPPVNVPWLRVDAGVGDLQVVVPAVREDRAAALRAVDDADAVDARRVAQEVAGAVVASVGLGVGRVLFVQSAVLDGLVVPFVVLVVRYWYPAGKPPALGCAPEVRAAAGMRTPRPSTVMPAPS